MQVAIYFPVNSVRNLAMLMARTQLVLNLDIDFMVSRELREELNEPAR